MEVKCYLAKGPELDQTMMNLLALTRKDGKQSLEELSNDRAGISLSRNREALILVGGRDSIHDFLLYGGCYPYIAGVGPFRVSFARKHRTLGKNETCVKLVCGPGHRQPEDGSSYVDLGAKAAGRNIMLTPPELAHCLHFIYGWG